MFGEVQSSESESSDVDDCVSTAYKKLTEDSYAAEAGRPGSHVLSPSTSSPVSNKNDNTSPKSDEDTNMRWFFEI